MGDEEPEGLADRRVNPALGLGLAGQFRTKSVRPASRSPTAEIQRSARGEAPA